MTSKTQQFIEKMLQRAEYKFDESVKEWAGWINGAPGIYAQGKQIENVRQELAEMLEEYLFVSVLEGQRVKGFDINIYTHAKTHQPQRTY